jgi:hypothetical protein
MRVGGGLGEVVDDLVGSEVLVVEVGGMANLIKAMQDVLKRLWPFCSRDGRVRLYMRRA